MRSNDTPRRSARTARSTAAASPSAAASTPSPADDADALERAFWGEATRPRRAGAAAVRRPARTPGKPGSRQHTQTIPITPAPVDVTADGAHPGSPTLPTTTVAADPGPSMPAGPTSPTPARPVDPLLRRVGLLSLALLVAVPVAMAVGDDEAPSRLRTASAPSVDIPRVGSSDPDLLAPTAGSAATSATLAPTAAPTLPPTTLPTTAPPSTARMTTASSVLAIAVKPSVIVATTAATAATVATTAATTPPTAAPTAPPTDPPTTAAPVTAAPATAAPTAPPTTADHAAAHAAAVAACGNRYTVQPGDYWFLLAGRSGVPISDLLRVNAATVDTPLYPGRKICLPPGASISVTTTPPATAAPPSTPAATNPPATQPPATQPPATTPATAPATTAPPTTAAPTTSTPAPPPPANTYSRAEVEAIIRDVWPDDLEDEAVRIATRESNLIPTVRNYCCFGLFQLYFSVHRSWLDDIGITSAAQLYDPRVNATAAYVLYQRSGGWGPWT